MTNATHERMAQMAERLIARHGRAMKLVKLSRSPGDGAKPWRGPATSAAGVEAELDVMAVFTSFSEDEIDGESVKKGDQKVLVAARPLSVSIEDFDAVVDGDRFHSIVGVRIVQPGETRIVYALHLRD